MTADPSAHLVDAHFHADLQKDPKGIIADCETRGIYTIAVTNAPSVFHHTASLVASTKCVRAAVGLHPELVATHGHELPELLKLMETTRYVGEVGLDYTKADERLRQKQRAVFEAVVARSAELGGRILTVHSRRAVADVIACLGSRPPGAVILHWFTGSKRELSAAIAAGCYFSVNPAMARAERGQKLVMDIPHDRLLTETDGPFVQVNGRPAVPPDVDSVVESVAAMWRTEREDVARRVFASFRAILECCQRR